MKTITLTTAVMLAIKEISQLGPFSAYDVTLYIRLRVDIEYLVSDANSLGDGMGTDIDHDEVRGIVVELFENELFEATKGYRGHRAGSYILYTPLVATNTSVPAPQTTNVPSSPGVNACLDKINAYLKHKGTATTKQIQSTLKIHGLTCEDILNLLGINYSTADKLSKVVVAGI